MCLTLLAFAGRERSCIRIDCPQGRGRAERAFAAEITDTRVRDDVREERSGSAEERRFWL